MLQGSDFSSPIVAFYISSSVGKVLRSGWRRSAKEMTGLRKRVSIVQ